MPLGLELERFGTRDHVATGGAEISSAASPVGTAPGEFATRYQAAPHTVRHPLVASGLGRTYLDGLTTIVGDACLAAGDM